MSDILKEICEYKKEVVQADKAKLSLMDLRSQVEEIKTAGSFYKNIQSKVSKGKTAIIAEAKKQSPSQGLIRENFNIEEIAQDYKEGGATCMSVLTDEKYFKGHNNLIRLAKEKSGLPILRKDFIIDSYQIYQSKLLGADAILLIMACLELEQAKEFELIANSIGLDVLVESHNEEELKNALKLNTKLVGVNNRNLKTLDISLENIKNLHSLVPSNKIVICESGINSTKDLESIKQIGINAFLIGGYLMKQSDIPKTLKNLLK